MVIAKNRTENILKAKWGTRKLNSINENSEDKCGPKVATNRTYFR